MRIASGSVAALLAACAVSSANLLRPIQTRAIVDTRNSTKNSTMVQLVPDEELNFSVMVSLANAPYQGADVGEVLVAANNIKEGDLESFYGAFNDLATRVHGQGMTIDAHKHPVSARQAFFRSASYYRSADAFLHGNWSDPRIMTLWKQQTEDFNKAMELLPQPGERIEIRADNFTVPAIFFKCDKPGRRPTVIIGTGYDGAMEDLYHQMGEALLQRGMNAIVYEGPGQPTVRRYQGLGFIPEWERVVSPVVDYVVTRSDVDASRVALMGYSFGGYLASRAAAFEHRLAAVMALDGIYDFGQAMYTQYGSDVEKAVKAGKKTELDEEINKLQVNPKTPSNVRWGIDQGKWSFKTNSIYEFLRRSEAYTMKNIIQNVSAPVFVGDGQSDMYFAGQAKELAEHLGDRATYHLFEDIQGAGLHCQIGGLVLMNQVSLDWLEDIFAAIKDDPSRK